MRRFAIMVLLGWLPLLGGCGTATYVHVESSPAGARIFVQGVDTKKVTPARIDIEAHARNPDEPMPVEVRMSGHVPTRTMPYPPRHRCDRLVCEHRRRTCVSQRLPLHREGTGLRVESARRTFEVAVDDGPWIDVDGPGSAPESDDVGVTIPVTPGAHVFWWRDRARTAGSVEADWPIRVEVPSSGYVMINLHRWPWGIPPRDAAAGTRP